jgi:hypothetical protein
VTFFFLRLAEVARRGSKGLRSFSDLTLLRKVALGIHLLGASF